MSLSMSRVKDITVLNCIFEAAKIAAYGSYPVTVARQCESQEIFQKNSCESD